VIDKQEIEKIKKEIHRLNTKLRAIDRVQSNLLIPYKDILLNRDVDWVAYAPFNEILDWCKANE